ncbi:hypothetical protein D6D28_10549 [Aureobasidium pullulans]|uniref:Apple domain-containing protein n=1 Tax=Aureobasidium pullulans TaxID=5580 RepID=A0A4S8RXF2_AURPU|nr:hypothetical protein D6D28_10549 [Aureobasidium pullulans]
MTPFPSNMKSIVAALALSVVTVHSAVPAPYPVLAPYSSINATALPPTAYLYQLYTLEHSQHNLCVSQCYFACPTTDVYSTSTVTSSGIGTVYYVTTTTLEPSTRVVESASYVATESLSLGSLTTEYTYVLTDYETRYDTTTTISTSACVSTATKTGVATVTEYTGTFTPSPLPTYCPTTATYTTIYPEGEVTSTNLRTDYDVVTSTSYYLTTSTHVYWDSTTTVTSSIQGLTYLSGGPTITTTYPIDCASTSYTSTASTTVAQAAKCAPTNLYSGLGSIGNPDGLDTRSYWRTDDPVNKDASSCCQACVDDANCVAMDYYVGEGYGCDLFLTQDGQCGKGIAVTYGYAGQGTFVQAGCGYVALA